MTSSASEFDSSSNLHQTPVLETVTFSGESIDSSSAILSSKVNNVISLNTQSSSFSSALTTISSLESPEKVDAKSIRSAIEMDSLHQVKSLEDHVTNLVRVVKDLRGSIKEIVSITEKVRNNISVVVPHESKSNDIYDEEKMLAITLAHAFREKNEAEDRYRTLNLLMEKYDLSQSDSDLLENYNFEDVIQTINTDESSFRQSSKDGLAFLDTLKKVTHLRDELSLSAASMSESPNEARYSKVNSDKLMFGPTSTIRMLENLASKQERAFERLYHFLHSRLDLSATPMNSSHASLGNLSSASVPPKLQYDNMDDTLSQPFVKSAIVLLRHVPAYYKHTLELIASNRRANGTKTFLLALTSGHDGMPPIEMKAHDPVNYVGDMLAFVFRAVSLESEMISGLFVDDDILIHEEDDDLMAVNVLNDALSGIARPLKNRILQVISSLACRNDTTENFDATHTSVVDEEASSTGTRLSALYSVCGLLLFYHSAIDKVFRKLLSNTQKSSLKESFHKKNIVLVECISESLEECSRAFGSSLKVFSATIDVLANISDTSQSYLSANLLELLCKVRSVSPGFGISIDRFLEINTVLSLEFLCDNIIGPILSSCDNIDDAVNLKRAFESAKDAGLEITTAMKWDQSLSDLESEIIENQIAADTSIVLELVGLADIATAFEDMITSQNENIVMSSYPGLSSNILQNGVTKFYDSLLNPPLPSYEIIKNPILRKYARGKIAANLISTYRSIYDFSKSENGCYDNLAFLIHEPAKVEVLLGI